MHHDLLNQHSFGRYLISIPPKTLILSHNVKLKDIFLEFCVSKHIQKKKLNRMYSLEATVLARVAGYGN